MKRLKEQHGSVLLMVLILAAIMLIIMAALVTMIGTGVSTSGMQKRYKTALQGAAGGGDVVYQFIGARGDPLIPLTNFSIQATAACVTDKLTKPTGSWAVGVGGCSSNMSIDPATVSTYDLRFDLGGYRVYSKIAHTVEGNSGPDAGLRKTGVVIMNPGEIAPVPLSYLHTIEILSQNLANPVERARMSVLYEY